jgi:hypothetical protein
MYSNSAVAAVVVQIEQNVIKQTRLEIFFCIISVLFIFELGCHLGMTQGTLVNQGVYPRVRIKIKQNVIKWSRLRILFQLFSILYIFMPE